MVHYWLMKSEPSVWSWQNQLDRGEQGEGMGWCPQLSGIKQYEIHGHW